MTTTIRAISAVASGVTGTITVNGTSTAGASTISLTGFTGGTSPAINSVFKIGSTFYQVLSVAGSGATLTIGMQPSSTGHSGGTSVLMVADSSSIFSSLSTWESTTRTLAAGNVEIGEIWSGAGINGGVSFTGTGRTATTYRMLRAGYNQQYNPFVRTGAYITHTATYTTTALLDIQESFFRVEAVAILVNFTTETGTKYPIYVNNAALTDVDIHRCFVRVAAIDTSSTSLNGVAIKVNAGMEKGKLYNNVVVGHRLNSIGRFDGIDVEGGANAANAWGIFHNSIYNFVTTSGVGKCLIALASTSGVAYVQNNIAAKSSGSDFFSNSSNVNNNNMTSDASGSGYFPFTTYGAPADELFVNPDYDDLRLRYSSRAADIASQTTTPYVVSDDYFGNTRTGLYDCGAFNGVVIPASVAPTIVVNSIGSAGRDYATIAAWESATRLNLVNNNVVYIGELYADSEFNLGVGTENTVISGAVTDSTRYRQLRTATNQQYDPISATGVRIRGQGTASVITINEDYFKLSGVRIESDYTGSSNRACIRLLSYYNEIDRCYLRGTTGTCGVAQYVCGIAEEYGQFSKITNCIIVGSGTTTGLTYGIFVISPSQHCLVANCIAYKVYNNAGTAGYGFRIQPNSDNYIKNCIGAANRTDFYTTSVDPFMLSCCSTDATAVGFGALPSKTITDIFYDHANDNFQLKAGSPCLNTGVNLSLDFTDDFTGVTRSAPWEIGAYDGVAKTIEVSASDNERSLRYSTCWKIERKDGVALYFTDHNQVIYLYGQPYTPAGGFDSTVVRRELGMKADDSDYSGVVTSDAITHEDLRAGRYNKSRVTEYVVDWRYPWALPQLKAVYYIKGVSYDSEVWTAQVSGVAYTLQQESGRRFNRQCDTELFSDRCKVLKTSFTTYKAVVNTVTSRTLFTGTTGSISGALGDNYFKYGKLVFRTGANSGIETEVRSYTSSTRLILLQIALPYDIQVGDIFDISAGCDHTQTGAHGCKTKFSNLVNYQGFREIPGTDAQLQTPMR